MAPSRRRVVSRRVGQAAAVIVQWLRADPRDVVRVLPRDWGGATAPAAAGPLTPELARWGHLLRRRRLVVLARRQLSVALGAGVVIGVVALAAGSDLRTRPLWWVAVLAALIAGLACAARRPLDVSEVARLLDRDLALEERIGTALEIEPATTPAVGLTAIVVSEANAAMTRSMAGGARAACRPAPTEWATLAALATALVLLLLVPAPRTGAPPRPGVSVAAANVHAGATAKATVRRTASSGVRAAHRTMSVTRPTSSSTLRVELGQAGRATRGALTRGTSGLSPARALSKVNGRSGASPTGARFPGGPTRVGPESSAGSPGVAATAAHNSRPGGLGSGTGRSASSTSGSRTAAATSGVPRAGASPLHSGSVRGASAASAAAPSGVISAKHARAGGESVGHAAGTSRLGPRSSARLATSVGGLQIQSGYAPIRQQASSRTTGLGSAASGGSGAPRVATAHEDGAGVAVFPYIPSSPGDAPGVDEDLLLSYFSPFSWFSTASW